MPLAGDFFKFTAIHQLDGVLLQNGTFWEIADMGTNTTGTQLATILASEWELALQGLYSNKMNFFAYGWENLSRNEGKILLTSTSNGNLVEDSHPQDQVAVITRYGQTNPVDPIKRSVLYLSGLAESLSTRGRINDETEFDSIKALLTGQLEDSSTNAKMNPMVRWKTPGSNPAVWNYNRTFVAEMSAVLRKLKSRKTNIVGA